MHMLKEILRQSVKHSRWRYLPNHNSMARITKRSCTRTSRPVWNRLRAERCRIVISTGPRIEEISAIIHKVLPTPAFITDNKGSGHQKATISSRILRFLTFKRRKKLVRDWLMKCSPRTKFSIHDKKKTSLSLCSGLNRSMGHWKSQDVDWSLRINVVQCLIVTLNSSLIDQNLMLR